MLLSDCAGPVYAGVGQANGIVDFSTMVQQNEEKRRQTQASCRSCKIRVEWDSLKRAVLSECMSILFFFPPPVTSHAFLIFSRSLWTTWVRPDNCCSNSPNPSCLGTTRQNPKQLWVLSEESWMLTLSVIILLNNHHDLVLQSLELLRPDKVWIIESSGIGIAAPLGSFWSWPKSFFCLSETQVISLAAPPRRND